MKSKQLKLNKMKNKTLQEIYEQESYSNTKATIILIIIAAIGIFGNVIYNLIF